MSIWMGDLTREEVAAIAPEGVAVLTISATEQHGDHLPLHTDWRIGSHITEGACRLLATELPILACPVLPYGNSHHHFPWPTLSLRSETLIAVLKDLVDSLARCGFRKVFILNAHGGNDEAIRITARDLARELGITIGAASYWTPAWNRLRETLDRTAPQITRVPGHAGDFETSVMLAIEPERVRMNRRSSVREDAPQHQELRNRVFIQRPGNSVGLAGVSDDSRHADAEAGAAAIEAVIEEVAAVLRSFHRG
ncbi:creatininase family protein [Chelatococcus asaccharovorans]|uniref:Creatinine amidohydrolase n=1 Tax=Chelatococcus asaccharovorans TaxID=28210 RepID=A0A2V3UIF2_9HYPH|nr:creatininase family protein [Chelatococcus asaccharovorans]MBS7706271.1 creatininase family protein [Chelatococcus asaccharovorans]PXW65091.1 creatinine amidohydrolase [Chelatococcus asaccharovorans]CAH1660721.1 Creatinine amidohydrolase [Chelatococcus asaccharovorans]CAH1683699.1 Creatinine amidohydrolase [Chelatococcus asaccharovorans]